MPVIQSPYFTVNNDVNVSWLKEQEVEQIEDAPDKLLSLDRFYDKAINVITAVYLYTFGLVKDIEIKVAGVEISEKFPVTKLFKDGPEGESLLLNKLSFAQFKFHSGRCFSDWVSSADLDWSVTKTDNGEDDVYPDSIYEDIGVYPWACRLHVSTCEEATKAIVSLVAVPRDDMDNLPGTAAGSSSEGYPCIMLDQFPAEMAGEPEKVHEDYFPFYPVCINQGPEDIGVWVGDLLREAMSTFWSNTTLPNVLEAGDWSSVVLGSGVPNQIVLKSEWTWPVVNSQREDEVGEETTDESASGGQVMKPHATGDLTASILQINGPPLSPRPVGRRSWFPGGKIESLMSSLSLWYLILMVVFSILFNYSWCIYTKITLTTLEAFYTYLYLTSIFVLVVMLVEQIAYPQEYARQPRHSQVSPSLQRSRTCDVRGLKTLMNILIIIFTNGMSCFLGIASIIFCAMEINVICQVFCGHLESGLTLAFINPIFLFILIILELSFVILVRNIQINQTYGMFWRCFYKFGMFHIIATNICLWIKLTFQETVSHLLHHHVHEHQHVPHSSPAMFFSAGVVFNQTSISSYSHQSLHKILLPPYRSSSAAFQCFTNLSSQCHPTQVNLWSMEESLSNFQFVEHNLAAKNILCPFIIEYSLLMGLVFYEASIKVFQTSVRQYERLISNNDEDQTDVFIPVNTPGIVDTPERRKTQCLAAIIGLSTIGFAGFIAISRQVGFVSYFSFVITILSSIGMIVALIYNHMDVEPSQESDETDEETLDESLLFVTLFGIILFNLSSVLPFIAEDPDMNYTFSLINNVSQMTHHLLQVSIISLCRRAKKMNQPLKLVMPFMMIYNLTEWILITFILTDPSQNEEYFSAHINFYGYFGWEFIWRITLPLMSFFRFHSFVLICGLIIRK